MNYEIVNLDEKIVVGVSAVTGNEYPEMETTIGALWSKLYQGGISSSIKNRTNEYTIGLYSDYNDNKYTVTVGHEVSKDDNKELVTKFIPSGKYAKFTIKGNMVTAVAEAWKEIWSMNLDRSFTGDFEEYLNSDFENSNINIYIALK